MKNYCNYCIGNNYIGPAVQNVLELFSTPVRTHGSTAKAMQRGLTPSTDGGHNYRVVRPAVGEAGMAIVYLAEAVKSEGLVVDFTLPTVDLLAGLCDTRAIEVVSFVAPSDPSKALAETTQELQFVVYDDKFESVAAALRRPTTTRWGNATADGAVRGVDMFFPPGQTDSDEFVASMRSWSGVYALVGRTLTYAGKPTQPLLERQVHEHDQAVSAAGAKAARVAMIMFSLGCLVVATAAVAGDVPMAVALAVFFIAAAAVTTGRVFRKAMPRQECIVIRRLPGNTPAGKKHQ